MHPKMDSLLKPLATMCAFFHDVQHEPAPPKPFHTKAKAQKFDVPKATLRIVLELGNARNDEKQVGHGMSHEGGAPPSGAATTHPAGDASGNN